MEPENPKKSCVNVTLVYHFQIGYNKNWRDVQTKNVVNNVDMSYLRAQWQNGPYKN